MGTFRRQLAGKVRILRLISWRVLRSPGNNDICLHRPRDMEGKACARTPCPLRGQLGQRKSLAGLGDKTQELEGP